LASNAYRQGARRRLAIIFIEVFKLLATPIIYGGRFDVHRQSRLLYFPSNIRQLINVREKSLFFFVSEVLFLVRTRYTWLKLSYTCFDYSY
jgi:hypothetical protein